jgi:hypothetical protein
MIPNTLVVHQNEWALRVTDFVRPCVLVVTEMTPHGEVSFELRFIGPCLYFISCSYLI